MGQDDVKTVQKEVDGLLVERIGILATTTTVEEKAIVVEVMGVKVEGVHVVEVMGEEEAADVEEAVNK